MRARPIWMLLMAATLAGCSSPEGERGASPVASTTSTTAAGPASTVPSSVAPTRTKLPAVQTVAKAGGVAIKATRRADWTLVAHGRAWVAGLGKGVGVYDARTGRPLGSVAVPQRPCAAMDEGVGAVWTATCQPGGVSRIDPGTARVTGHLDLPVPSDGESSIGVGEGAVWAITDGSACRICAVARIDPSNDRLVGCSVIDPAGVQGGDLTVGDGFVWFRGSAELVAQIDPKDGRVVRRIGSAKGSGSASAGSGQLWISAHDVATVYRVPVG